MKSKVKRMIIGVTLAVLMASPGYGGTLGGRISSDSPTVFRGGVNKIHFFSEGTKVVGNIHFPENYNKGEKLPAIVVIGPKGAVKEQTQGIYARKLSERGFITLVIDHRTYGESGGEPRHYENPYMKIEDAKTAISYIGSLGVVDKNRIGLLGVCNGGGFAGAAAVYDKRIKAFASIAGIFDLRSQIINGKPGDKKKLTAIMEKSGQARQKFFETGEVDYVQQMPDIDENSSRIRKEAYEYYRTLRGLVPNWGENKMATFSMDTRRSYDITDQFGLLSVPYLAIAGTEAMTFGLSQKAFERASEPKEFFKIEGASHVDMYDIDKYVNQAVKKLDMFYRRTLTKVSMN